MSRSEANRAGQDARPVTPPGGLTQDPPASLGAVGRSVWKTIVETGRYQDGDARVLERYCHLHDRRAVLLALVDTEGYVVPGPKQPSTGHPAIRLALDMDAQMIRLEAVLALSSEARARLGLASAEDDLHACCGAGA